MLRVLLQEADEEGVHALLAEGGVGPRVVLGDERFSCVFVYVCVFGFGLDLICKWVEWVTKTNRSLACASTYRG